MPAVRTTVLMGSTEEMPAQTLTIDGSAENIASGPFYLDHATPALDLLRALESAMNDAGLTNPVAELREDLRVRLASDDAFDIVWGTATILRDFLGFTGDLPALTSHVAPRHSRYIWSGTFPATKATPDGVGAYPVEDARIVTSADGTEQDHEHFVTHEWQELKYDVVPRSRVWALDGEWDGLTWQGFRAAVMVPGHRFQIYEEVLEDANSTASPVVLGNPDGTYRVREIPPGLQQRKVSNMNSHWAVSAKLRRVFEYA